MFFEKVFLDTLKPMKKGSLTLVLPDGRKEHFGGLYKGLQATIEVRDKAFFRKCVLFGPIGFGEAYVEGLWDTPDLTRVIAWFILNSDDSSGLETDGGKKSRGMNLLSAWNKFIHKRRANTLLKSPENIHAHYDLSNEFFKLWLDPTMTYSCAYFDPPELSLEEAQKKKYDQLCTKLQLQPKDLVLEIGCGWGGFAIHAAKNYGCRVTGITISEAQFDEATKRVKAAKLEDQIEILYSDYRNLHGRFDKIVSIEMLEAVGEKFVDQYFEKCHELLTPTGLLGLQAITCPDRQYRILRDGVDFIQKHIFPGSLLMSVARINDAINKTGTLNLLDLEEMSPFYAKTLKTWRETFDRKTDELEKLGFDEPFRRKWDYYLSYCEAAFATRHIGSVQLIYSRPNNTEITSPAYELLPSR